ncbi:MAG: 50S ribosomal protein L25/general stress protein Ctc [Rhodospirillales bacterium]|nr:50S ribosomal protein L25/general stress protein Ctc [Rhodospirillales bacterium]
MAIITTIEAAARERAGKGAARATRRQGQIPGVIYGAKSEPALIALDPRNVMREVIRGGWRSRLFEVRVGGQTTRALMRDVQFHPVTDVPEHVDFQRLAPGEKVRVAIGVHFKGDGVSPGIKRGGVLNIVRHSVDCYVDPEHVPEFFEADLGALDINDAVRFSNLTGTEGVRPTITDRDFVIATVAPPTKITEPTAEQAAAAGAAAPAAGAAAPAAGGAKAASPAAAAKAPAGKK